MRAYSETGPQSTRNSHLNAAALASWTGEEAEILVYVDDRISRVLLFPNNRVSLFRMSSIEVLLPETDPNGPITKGPERPG